MQPNEWEQVLAGIDKAHFTSLPYQEAVDVLQQGIQPEVCLNIRAANYHATSIADALEQPGK
ncbi:MAG: hypothetical protein JXA97_12820 [Anaerolineales bacterium]|nr:hypothetical protein [Anaerolineales bacterium]